MEQERTWILLSKYVAGEISADERDELEWVLRTNPAVRQTLETLRALRQAPPEGITAEDEQEMLQKGLERFTPSGKTQERLPNPVYPGLVSPTDSNRVNARDTASVSPIDPNRVNAMDRTRVNPTGPDGQRLSSRSGGLPYRWMAAASVVVILLGTAVVLLNKKRTAPGPIPPRVIAARRGVHTFMQLPDGSKLWLNAGSKVFLRDGFTDDKREVTLSGEAFFDVKHDPDHPFIIHAGKLDVKVLGTSLNIKAYPADSTIETTLISGKVEIGVAGDPRSRIVLKPSEKVIIRTGQGMIIADGNDIPHDTLAANTPPIKFTRSGIIPYKADGTIVETSWVENKLVFRNESIPELAGRLERWYDVKIVFDNNKYLKETFTGAFKDAKIDDVMHALKITSGFSYRINGDTVRIW